MAEIKAKMTEQLKQELKKFSSDICSQLAQEASRELTKEAKNAMAAFYMDYDPRKYRRTYGFYYKSYKKYYNNSRSKYYHGGVRITIPPTSYYRNGRIPVLAKGADFTKWDILDMVYNGYHGYAENFGGKVFSPPIMNPSPYDILLKKQKELVNTLGSDTKIQSIMRFCSTNYQTFKIV